VVGSAVGIGLSVGLAAAMVPLRPHIDVGTAGLVMVIPVVAGVSIGGNLAGLVSVVAGFLAYDYALVPPYDTLRVGAGRGMTTLAVYVVVMALVARVVARLDEARRASRQRERTAQRLFVLSELLLSDQPVERLARTIVEGVRDSFEVAGAALLISVDDHLEVEAASGVGVDEAALAPLRPGAHLPVALSTDRSSDFLQILALATPDRPVGLLALAGVPEDPAVRDVLPGLANHLALALERSQLHERIRRAELLEEIDRLRHALVGAVSHDLRTPLAAMKVASSALLEQSGALSEADVEELHGLIDTQTDRLSRIVNNVLDMTRIQAGVLEVRRRSRSVDDLIAASLAAVGPMLDGRVVDVRIPPSLPPVDVDEVLVEQAIANLVDNAHRHGPPGTAVVVDARDAGGDRVAVRVTDRGPGVPRAERQAIFDSFVRFDTGGRAGLGLAIARAFVEAHGERVWVEDGPGGGARFVVTLPVAVSTPAPA
jgi:two-component system sensor histidine kinase KdpD